MPANSQFSSAYFTFVYHEGRASEPQISCSDEKRFFSPPYTLEDTDLWPQNRLLSAMGLHQLYMAPILGVIVVCSRSLASENRAAKRERGRERGRGLGRERLREGERELVGTPLRSINPVLHLVTCTIILYIIN